MKRVAVLGGGLAGVTAAWQLAQWDRAQGGLTVNLFEATNRLGGTIETVLRDGFVVDMGADGWVTEKPWARELVRELGLHGKLIASQDEGRVTYIVRDGQLVAMPDGMRMMVPTDLAALDHSPLFSPAAKAAYAAEIDHAEPLKSEIPNDDESIATFVRRHFGEEVLANVAAPLLSGVFGGDVAELSVRAVMPAFVRMERQYGSLILGLQASRRKADACEEKASIFTSLVGGAGALIDRLAAELPPDWLRLQIPVTSLKRHAQGWQVNGELFDAVIMALPADVARSLFSGRMAELLEMDATSAVVVALAFLESFALPPGFGFLVPAGEQNALLAGTFVDQKFPGRVPEGGRLLRAFFGGEDAKKVAAMADAEIAQLGRTELEKLLGRLPEPAFTVVRRWPRSLPQYGVGHLQRMAELECLVKEQPNLWMIGNAYRGVGLPDLIRDARAAAREIIAEASV